MKNVWNFVRRLCSKRVKQRANAEDDWRRIDAGVGGHVSSESAPNRLCQWSHDSWPPQEEDYERVERLRDREDVWEWEAGKW